MTICLNGKGNLCYLKQITVQSFHLSFATNRLSSDDVMLIHSISWENETGEKDQSGQQVNWVGA